MKGVLFCLFLVVFLISNISAATYYVDATNGLDSNDGLSEGSAWLTIQKCLDSVVAGDTCMIRAGTYNEALILKTPGISSDRITIQNYNGETVTVNSGDSKALRAGGRMHYYTIDGLRFISNHIVYSTNFDYTIDLRDGIWDGDNNSAGGNNGFIIRNCYIEGAIHLYGHDNLVENCELNGMTLWHDGIWEMYGSSNNIYRGNTVHDYVARGIWSMANTYNITIEGNTIYDIPGLSGDCYGIDADGAGLPVSNIIIRNNRVYNMGGGSCGVGIGLENSFNSIVEGNMVSDTQTGGITVINYGPGVTNDGQEYRDDDLNSTIRNNIVYDSDETSILCNGASGVSVYANTISQNIGSGAESWYGGIVLFTYGGFLCNNWTIKNNIFYENSRQAIFVQDWPQGMDMNYNLYYDAGTQVIANVGWSPTYTLQLFQTTFSQESNSLFADPLFTNPLANDFHLQATSPAIDAGVDVGLTTDFDGNPIVGLPDIGAYEYQSVQSSCGDCIIEAEDMPVKSTGGAVTDGWGIWNNGYIAENVSFNLETFTFEIIARGTDCGDSVFPNMELRVDDFLIDTFTVDSTSWASYITSVNLNSGLHEIKVVFTNDCFNPPEDRNLFVDKIIVTEGAVSTCSSADTSGNSIIEIGELLTYISDWKAGSVTIGDLLTAIGEWKNGCPGQIQI